MDINTNLDIWNRTYDWSKEGEEWSVAWGGSDMEWYGTILPRIHAFIPTQTILEIAPGFGRWTRFLINLCKELILVDLSPKCIEACKKRFSAFSHVKYHVNDGKSLEMIPDESIDFVFSFDSLVHAEADVIESYCNQLGKKLKRNGVGFIHHSNLGIYSAYTKIIQNLPKKARNILERLGIIEKDFLVHNRATTMTAVKFRDYAKRAGLIVISQELINWSTKRLIDCISVFTRADSNQRAPGIIMKNKYFIKECRYIKRLSDLYKL